VLRPLAATRVYGHFVLLRQFLDWVIDDGLGRLGRCTAGDLDRYAAFTATARDGNTPTSTSQRFNLLVVVRDLYQCGAAERRPPAR